MIENICREGFLLIWESNSLAEFGRNSGPGRLVSSGRTRILDPFLYFDKRLLKAAFDAVNTPHPQGGRRWKEDDKFGSLWAASQFWPVVSDTSVFSAFA